MGKNGKAWRIDGRGVDAALAVAPRGVATRYEKRAGNYRAMVALGSLMLWLA